MIKKSSFFFFLILATLVPFSIATSLAESNQSDKGQVHLDISPAEKLAGMNASIYKKIGPEEERWIGYISLSNPVLHLPMGTYRLDFPSISGHKIALENPGSEQFTLSHNHQSISIKGHIVSNLSTACISLSIEGKPIFTKQPSVKLKSTSGQYYPLKFNPKLSNPKNLVFQCDHLPAGNFTLLVNPHSKMLRTPKPVDLAIKQSGHIQRTLKIHYLNPTVSVSVKNCEDPQPQVVFKQNEKIVKTYSGNQNTISDLKPGKYQVSVVSQDSRGPLHPQEIMLKPGDSNTAIEFNWANKPATLTVLYSTTLDEDAIADLIPVLTTPSGSRLCHKPQKKVLNQNTLSNQLTVIEYTFNKLPTGRYTLHCQGKSSKSVFKTPDPITIYLSAGQTISKTQTIQPYSNSLFVSVNPDIDNQKSFNPTISLFDNNHKLIAKNDALSLSCPSLAPGEYTLVFGNVDCYQTPAKKHITIDHNADVKINQTYSLQESLVQPIIETDLPAKYFQDSHITIRHAHTNEIAASWSINSGQMKHNDNKNLAIELEPIKLPASDYEIEFEIAQANNLLPKVSKQSFSITNNKPVSVITPIFGQFASLSLQVKCSTCADIPIDKETEQQVGFDLYRSNKKIFSHSGPKPIKLSKLSPDTYSIAFAPVEGYETPDTLSIDLKPGQDNSLIKIEYAPQPGSVVLESYLNHDIITSESYYPVLIRAETGEKILPSSIDVHTLYTGQQATFETVPAGLYSVEFVSSHSDNDLFKPDPIQISVEPAKNTHFHKQLQLADGSIEIETTFDYPLTNSEETIVSIRQDKGAIKIEGGKTIFIQEAPSGHYSVEWLPIDGLIQPNKKTFTLLPNESKSLNLHYSTDPTTLEIHIPKDTIPDTNQILVSLNANNTQLKIDELQPDTVKVESNTIIYAFKDIPKGDYTLQISLGQYQSHFKTQLEEHLSLTTPLIHTPSFEATRGCLSITSQGPEGPLDTHFVCIDQYGTTVFESNGNYSIVENLLPGDYTIQSAKLDGYYPVDSQVINISENQLDQEVLIYYSYKPGMISISFDTPISKEIAQNAPFELLNERGINIASPSIVHSSNYFTACFDELMPGEYVFSCSDPAYCQLLGLDSPLTIDVKPGESFEKTIHTTPHWAYLNIESYPIDNTYPRIAIYNAKNQLIYDTQKSKFEKLQLIPGDYIITYGDIEYYKTPADQHITLKPDDSILLSQHDYNRHSGSLQIYCNELAKPDLYDHMSFEIIPVDVPATDIQKTTIVATLQEDNEYGCQAENLPTGEYLLLATPLNPEYFTNIEPQTITIYSDETCELEYSTPIAWVNTQIQTLLPIHSTDEKNIHLEVQDIDGVTIHSNKGSSTECELLPGQYTLLTTAPHVFEELAPKSFTVTANQTPNIISQQLVFKESSLEMHLSLENNADQILHQASVWLHSKRSPDDILEMKATVREPNQLLLQSPKLNFGEYEVVIQLPENSFGATESRFNITIDNKEPLNIEKIIELPWPSLNITSNFEAPFLERTLKPITIYNTDNQIVKRSVQGSLDENILPGEYTVVYGDVEGYFTPESSIIYLEPGQVESISSQYHLMAGSALISYEASDHSDLIKDLNFVLSYEGKPIDLSLFNPHVYENENYQELSISGLPIGNYSITPIFNNDPGFIEKLETQSLTVSLDEESHINYVLPIHTGSIEITAELSPYKWNYTTQNTPKITLQKNDQTIESSNTLFLDRLPYGTYEVSFTDIKGWVTPEPITFIINEENAAHQLISQYQPDTNDLFIEIALDEGSEYVFNPKLHLSSTDGSINQVLENCVIDTDKETPCLRWSLKGLPKLNYTATVELFDPDSIFNHCNCDFECCLDDDHAIALKRTFKTIHHTYTIQANLPKHFENENVAISIQDLEGLTVQEGINQITFSAYRGKYIVSFGAHPQLNTPEDILISINESDTPSILSSNYTAKKGDIDIFIALEPEVDLPQKLKGELIDSNGHSQPIHMEIGYSSLRFTSKDRFIGEYTFKLSDQANEIISLPISVKEGDINSYNHIHTLETGTLKVKIQSSHHLQHPLELTVRSDDYMIELPIHSEESFILAPGTYTLYTKESSTYHESDKQIFQIEANQLTEIKVNPKYRSENISFSMNLPSQQQQWISYIINHGLLKLINTQTHDELIYPLNSLEHTDKNIHLQLPLGQWQASVECNKGSECKFFSETAFFNHSEESSLELNCQLVTADLTPLIYEAPRDIPLSIKVKHLKSGIETNLSVIHMQTIQIPEGIYEVSFETISNFITPNIETISIEPNDYNSLDIRYQKETASAQFNIVIEDHDQFSAATTLLLTDELGHQTRLSIDSNDLSNYTYKIENIPCGRYHCFIDSIDSLLADASLLTFDVDISANNSNVFIHKLPLSYASVTIELEDLKTPASLVHQTSGDKINDFLNGKLSINELKPGAYYVSQGDAFYYFTVNPNDSIHLQLGYNLQSSGLIYTWYKENIDSFKSDMITISLSSANHTYTPSQLKITDSSIEATFDSVFPGTYEISIDTNSIDQPFTPEITQCELTPSQVNYYQSTLKPFYGTLIIDVKGLPDGIEPELTITNTTNNSSFVHYDRNFISNNLEAGEYIISFAPIPTLTPPNPIQLKCIPFDNYHAITASYQTAKGDLSLLLNHPSKEEYPERSTYLEHDLTHNKYSIPLNDSTSTQVELKSIPTGNYKLCMECHDYSHPITLENAICVHEKACTDKCISLDEMKQTLSIKANLPESFYEKTTPLEVTIYNSLGNTVHSEELPMEIALLPGKYYVEYSEISGLLKPFTSEVSISPEHPVTVEGNYQTNTGSLFIELKDPSSLFLNDLEAYISDTNGQMHLISQLQSPMLSTEKILENSKILEIHNIPVDTYTVMIKNPSSDLENKVEKTISIIKDQEQVIRYTLQQQYSHFDADIVFQVNPETHPAFKERALQLVQKVHKTFRTPKSAVFPELTLTNSYGQRAAFHHGIGLTANQLPLGAYSLHASKLNGFSNKELTSIDLNRPQNFHHTIAYEPALGNLLIIYSGGDGHDHMPELSIRILNEDQLDILIQSDQYEVSHDGDTSYIAINNIPVGRYGIEISSKLLSNDLYHINQTFDAIISESTTTKAQFDFNPSWASIDCIIMIDDETIYPSISIIDPQGNIFMESDEGFLSINKLPPGTWTLEFETVNGYLAPEPLSIFVEADSHIGPLFIDYIYDQDYE